MNLGSATHNFLGKSIYFPNLFVFGGQCKNREAALGICFPLKAYSSHPMHPVPHLQCFFDADNELNSLIKRR